MTEATFGEYAIAALIAANMRKMLEKTDLVIKLACTDPICGQSENLITLLNAELGIQTRILERYDKHHSECGIRLAAYCFSIRKPGQKTVSRSIGNHITVTVSEFLESKAKITVAYTEIKDGPAL